jgi:hypothetical protein
MLQPTDSENRSPINKQQQIRGQGVNNKIFVRLPKQSVSFFEEMAQDYYERGIIPAPSIGLLTKACLITAGNAWNRLQFQLMNKEVEINEVRGKSSQSQPQEINYENILKEQLQGEVRSPRQRWHLRAPTLQLFGTLWNWRQAVAGAREADASIPDDF